MIIIGHISLPCMLSRGIKCVWSYIFNYSSSKSFEIFVGIQEAKTIIGFALQLFLWCPKLIGISRMNELFKLFMVTLSYLIPRESMQGSEIWPIMIIVRDVMESKWKSEFHCKDC